MEQPRPISDPDYWRNRAEEARALGEQLNDPHTKAIMFDIAQSYEQIAKWVGGSVSQ